jgi:dipeptidyl aminopeptidase/acylaminoacyl peptidase
MRRVLVLVLLAGACGGRQAELEPTLPPPEAPPPEEAAAPPAAAAPRPANSDPDPASNSAREKELAARAAIVVAAFANKQAELTRDGKTLYFLSDRDGISTLYRADAGDPAAPATRLLDRPERIGDFRVSRDGRSLILRSDTSGDERWSLFRADLDGANLVELTPGARLQRGPAFEPAGAPGRLYHVARRLDSPTTEIHEVALAGGAPPRTVFSTPQPAGLLDVSRDGRTLAVIRFASASESWLDLVDVATGKARTLYPRAGASADVHDAHFSADGRRLLVTTDGGGEKPLLLALDRAGRELARHVESGNQWNSLDWPCVLSRKGDRLACAVARGEQHELRVYDAARLRPALSVTLPAGTGGPTAFSDDGSRLLIDWTTPSAPVDVFAVDTRSGEARPLRADPRPGLDELPGVEVSVAEVAAHDGLPLRVNVTLPATRSGRLPVIVSYHGGPAHVSMLRWVPYGRFFTALGYAWVEPNVRGSAGFGRAFEMADNGAKRLDAFKDVETTGRWAAAQPWADPERVVVWGQSYGGYTVLIALSRFPDLWRAGVDLYGPTDLVSFLQSTTGLIREVFKIEFGDLDRDRELLESMSPLRDAGKIEDPLFVFTGANDPRVPRSESDQLVLALRQRGVRVEYMVAEDEGHALARKPNLIAFMARAARFLEDALR